MNKFDSASLIVMETNPRFLTPACERASSGRNNHFTGEPPGSSAVGDRVGALDNPTVSLCAVLN